MKTIKQLQELLLFPKIIEQFDINDSDAIPIKHSNNNSGILHL